MKFIKVKEQEAIYMNLDNIAILLSNTVRSQAYLQLLVKNKFFPKVCLFLVKSEEELNKIPYNSANSMELEYFNMNETLLETVKKNNLNYIIVGTDLINSEDCVSVLEKVSCSYIIFSGYGGAILKKPLFEIGKKWIHIHAGLLPEYRGSTTVYYSMLEKDIIGASAIILNEKIDSGNIIAKKEFLYPTQSINIDYVYDPYIRASLLVDVVEDYVKENKFITHKQLDSDSFDYYIIHPVLKHLALLTMN